MENEEDKSDLENAYLGAQLAHEPDSEGDEDNDEPNPLVHESFRKEKKHNRGGAKTKFVPADETAERRDQRTIFIGNLSVEVAQKRVSRRFTNLLNRILIQSIFLLSRFLNSSSYTS
jgi:nucleolar protein 12